MNALASAARGVVPVLGGVLVFVLTVGLTFEVTLDKGSPIYAGWSTWGPVLTAWLSVGAIGLALLALRQWTWGAVWLTAVIAGALVSIGATLLMMVL